jgi:hypothetical protein
MTWMSPDMLYADAASALTDRSSENPGAGRRAHNRTDTATQMLIRLICSLLRLSPRMTLRHEYTCCFTIIWGTSLFRNALRRQVMRSGKEECHLPGQLNSRPGFCIIATLLRTSAMRPKLLSDILLVIVTGVWGMNFAVMKAAYDYFDPLAFTALRFIVAASALLILFKLRGIPLKGKRRISPALTGLGLLGTRFTGLLRYRPGRPARQRQPLVSTAPVFAYLTGVVLKREAFSRRVLAGIFLSMAGGGRWCLDRLRSISDRRAGDADPDVGHLLGLLHRAAARLISSDGAMRLTLCPADRNAGDDPLLAPYLLRQDWSAIPLQGWLVSSTPPFSRSCSAILPGPTRWSIWASRGRRCTRM